MDSEEFKKKDLDLKELRVQIEPEVFDKLDEIMEFYGIKNRTEIIRFMITQEYRKIKRRLY